jgi:hypothetical protein
MRPYVTVKENNILDELLGALEQSLYRFKEYRDLAGIMLDGGLSRGYGDRLSEIDVVLFLHETGCAYYKEHQTPTALGITKIDGYLFDVKLLNYEEELEKKYDDVGLWDLSYAKILYDPKGALQKLFDDKLQKKVLPEHAGGNMFNAWWYFRLAGDIWINRGDSCQGHMMLNEAVKKLVSALFQLNGEYIPHEKWLLHMSRTLEWKPEEWDYKLQQMMSTGDMSLADLQARQKCIEEVYNEIDAHLCELLGNHSGLGTMYQYFYDLLPKLMQKDSYSIEEWNEVSDIESLQGEPLHSLFHVEGDRVIFDRQKFMTLDESQMYEWFLTVVKAVRTEL